MLSVQSVVESQSRMESSFLVRVHLASSTALFPVYNSITETAGREVQTNNLMDVTQKSAFILETGDLVFSNERDERCPPGFSSLIIRASPRLLFAENQAVWWN
jgi:hypothetical protein